MKTILLTYCVTFLTIESSTYDGRAGIFSFYYWFFLAKKGRGFTVRQSRGAEKKATPLRKRPTEDLRCHEKSFPGARGFTMLLAYEGSASSQYALRGKRGHSALSFMHFKCDVIRKYNHTNLLVILVNNL